METRLYLGLLSTLTLDALLVWTLSALVLSLPRFKGPNARRLVLALPLIKIAWDLMVLVPGDWAIHRGLDLFTRPPNSISLNIGAGLKWCLVPFCFVSLSSVEGRLYATDFIYPHVGCGPAAAVVLFVASVSIFMVVRRFVLLVLDAIDLHFEIQRFERIDLQALGLPRRIEEALAKTRTRVFSMRGDCRVFAVGILAPMIVVGERARARLSKDELAAAIAHELGHVRTRDAIIALFSQLIADVAWFLPFVYKRVQQLRFEAERAADRVAIDLGCAPSTIASALVTAAEALLAPSRSTCGHPQRLPGDRVLVPCLASSRSEVERRVHELVLLEPHATGPDRHSWCLMRSLAYAGFIAFCLFSGAGGV